MPHLNELHETYADKGLSVLAVTDEPRELTEAWIREKGAHYPFAYDKGGALHRELGVTGIPDAVLVDPTGRVVYQGSPHGVTAELIEQVTEGALGKPLYEWPEEASSVVRWLKKREFAKALAEAEKLQDESYRDSIRSLIDARRKLLSSLRDAGDYLSAYELATRLKKELAGLDAGDEAAAICREISSDVEAKRVMRGQKKVRELRQEPVRSRKDAAERIEELEKIIRKYEGTAAARDAREYADELREMVG